MPVDIIQSLGEIFRSKFLWSGSRHYWVYMLGYIAIAFILYQPVKASGKSFLSFLFPRKIYSHPSVILDFKIWLIIIVIIKLGLFTVIFAGVSIATGLVDNALDLLGPAWQVDRTGEPPGFTDRLLFLIVFTACGDFGFFIMHYIYHRISWLWAFHKVHHSAEVLTPITANRHHPIDYLLEACAAFLMYGVATTVFTRYHGIEVDTLTILNVSAIHFIYYMTANLRHSHLWLGFGKWMSCIFISPAMHQIHHSVAPHHYNKNFGFIFSFWDWIFRTRYIPSEKEELVFGLANGEAGYTGFFDSMLRPFKECFEQIITPGTWLRSNTQDQVTVK